MLKFFSYQGNKLFLSDVFNKLTYKRNKLYIEPFVGSGSIFVNTLDIYESYIISDIDKNIFLLWSSLQKASYNDYVDVGKFIEITFGDIQESKKSYYKFRKYYNKNFHQVDSFEKGIYLYFLVNACINGILRFGPNGMNQSWGHRSYFFDKSTYDRIREKLRNTVVLNIDFYDLMKKLNPSGTVLFLDPPYHLRPTTYNKNFDINKFIPEVLRLSLYNDIFYTDIENEKSDALLNNGFEKIKIRDVRNISPSESSEIVGLETLYYKTLKKSKYFTF